MEYGPSRHRQHSRSSPCGRDWHRPTESSTSSIIQNHPAAMGGRSLTGPPFFVAARKFVEVLQYGGKRILKLIHQTEKVSTTGFMGVASNREEEKNDHANYYFYVLIKAKVKK